MNKNKELIKLFISLMFAFAIMFVVLNQKASTISDDKALQANAIITKGLGTYIAEDTGGAIKGKIIDFYFDTHEEALKFGRQKVNLRIVSSTNGGN